MNRLRSRAWWSRQRSRAVILALLVALGTVSVQATAEPRRVRQHTDARFEELTRQQRAASASLVHDFCAYIAPQADPEPRPTTERGRLAQQAAVRLSQRLHCPPG